MSTPKPRFLLDENVRIELAFFLRSRSFSAQPAPESTADSTIAALSKKEKRILVTNDEDFLEYTRDEIFSVVWLRIPQNDPKSLVASFDKLLGHFRDFPGRLVVLKPGDWDDFPLGEKFEFKPKNK